MKDQGGECSFAKPCYDTLALHILLAAAIEGEIDGLALAKLIGGTRRLQSAGICS